MKLSTYMEMSLLWRGAHHDWVGRVKIVSGQFFGFTAKLTGAEGLKVWCSHPKAYRRQSWNGFTINTNNSEHVFTRFQLSNGSVSWGSVVALSESSIQDPALQHKSLVEELTLDCWCWRLEVHGTGVLSQAVQHIRTQYINHQESSAVNKEISPPSVERLERCRTIWGAKLFSLRVQTLLTACVLSIGSNSLEEDGITSLERQDSSSSTNYRSGIISIFRILNHGFQ